MLKRPGASGWLKAFARDERGQTAIAILLVFLGVFALAGLALDAGFWYFDHRTAQNQTEAASLAAIQDLPDDPVTAKARAIDWLKQNGVDETVADNIEQVDDSTDCGDMTVPAGQSGKAKILFSNSFYSAKVCLRRESLVLLSGLANITKAKVSASAKATVQLQPLTYALMAMNPDDCTGTGDGLRSLNLAGSPGVEVNLLDEGGSYTRSPCNGAMYIDGGNVTFNAGGTHDVVGQCAPSTNCTAQVTPDPTNDYSDLLTDPFAQYTQPTPDSCLGFLPGKSDWNFPNNTGANGPAGAYWILSPGTYCSALTVGSTAIVHLSDGTYVFRSGLMVSGNSPQLISDGPTLLYFTCTAADALGPGGNSCCPTPAGSCTAKPPEAPGCSVVPGESQAATFCLQGNDGQPSNCGPAGTAKCPAVDIEGQDEEPKAVIWVDRTAQAWNTTMVRIAGQGNIVIDGNIYTISGSVGFEGNGVGQNVDVTGTIIADKIKFAGRATYDITWDADLAPKEKVFALVE